MFKSSVFLNFFILFSLNGKSPAQGIERPETSEDVKSFAVSYVIKKKIRDRRYPLIPYLYIYPLFNFKVKAVRIRSNGYCIAVNDIAPDYLGCQLGFNIFLYISVYRSSALVRVISFFCNKVSALIGKYKTYISVCKTFFKALE